MTFTQIWLNSYLHPRRAMDAVAQLKTPCFGALYALIRGLLLAFLFYLPFYLLEYKPITPTYLKIFDTPDYFLYAVFIWPLFGLLSWVYLEGVVYVALRLLRYPANFDQMLNLGGLLNLTIGIVILIFDWLMVAIKFHNNAYFMGIAHMVIADPWSITLTAIFYKKYFGVPIWLSVLLGITVRILYIPLAMVFIRS
jgi:hypothetical protein